MSKEELKQEAEESFEQYKVTDEDYVVSPYSDDMGEKMLMYNDEYYAEETYLRLYKQGYLAGAEPREKRIEELEKENAELKEKLEKATTHRISNCNKANEFHYCKDGLPEKEKSVLIYTEIKNVYMAKLVKDDYFITKEGGYVQTSAVIAWKEIVLPELKGGK